MNPSSYLKPTEPANCSLLNQELLINLIMWSPGDRLVISATNSQQRVSFDSKVLREWDSIREFLIGIPSNQTGGLVKVIRNLQDFSQIMVWKADGFYSFLLRHLLATGV